jgi:ribosome production factor 1
LQEIGPRFTLKLRWLKKGIPAVHSFGENSLPLELGAVEGEDDAEREEVPLEGEEVPASDTSRTTKVIPPKQDEVLWAWKVCDFLTYLFTLMIYRSL